jgi:hypothetical protein
LGPAAIFHVYVNESLSSVKGGLTCPILLGERLFGFSGRAVLWIDEILGLFIKTFCPNMAMLIAIDQQSVFFVLGIP